MQTIIFRMEKQGPPVYSTGNYIKSPGINHDEKNINKKNVYIYVCVCIHIFILFNIYIHSFIYTHIHMYD